MRARDMMVAAMAALQRGIYSHGDYHVEIGAPTVWGDDDEHVMWDCAVRDTDCEEHRTPGGRLGTLHGEARTGERRPRIWFAAYDGKVDVVSFPHLDEYNTLPLRDARRRGYQSSPFMLRHPAA